jgi:hypothetical protein
MFHQLVFDRDGSLECSGVQTKHKTKTNIYKLFKELKKKKFWYPFIFFWYLNFFQKSQNITEILLKVVDGGLY